MFWNTTPAWTHSATQFDYFSNPDNGYINGQIIDVYKGQTASGKGSQNIPIDDLSAQVSSLGVQPGDLLYFYKDDGIHHAAVVSEVADGKILYSANSITRYDHDLEEAIKNEKGILIVRLKDESNWHIEPHCICDSCIYFFFSINRM